MEISTFSCAFAPVGLLSDHDIGRLFVEESLPLVVFSFWELNDTSGFINVQRWT
jgi:hypothetical protein